MKVQLIILSLFFCAISFAQNSISGIVTNSENQPISGANIKIIGESSSTVTDMTGNFILKTSKQFPFTIEVTSLGLGKKSIEVKNRTQKISVQLTTEDLKLDEIVVAASRTPEKVKESPVTIERMTIKDIKKSASPSYYDALENMKEVQMNTSSMSFKSINTRGFATVSNTRFMQLVDGMDNSSPLLNFVLGNMIGISEIDVQSVELLPGASSALYGANAFNGILFMNSKNPFTSEGVTAYAKYGQTNQKAAGANEYYDYGVRVAHKFSDYFAAKANFTFMSGTDWYATDYRDLSNPGKDRSYYNYNGMNVYGDEVAKNLKDAYQLGIDSGSVPASQAGAINLLPDTKVSRTGYNETDLTDSKVRNSKIDFSLHTRPFGNDKFEVIWQSKFGFGNAVYQGASRYYLNGFFMQQHKLEFKGKNFFVRGYTTTEDGGKSYDMTFTAININRTWKSDSNWFKDYLAGYIGSTLSGLTPAQAHANARTAADTGRLLPGTDAYKAAYNAVIANPDVIYGSKLVDNSHIYHSDANYNFKDLIKVAEIQVGGSYRLYDLNSQGRIYTDEFSAIKYNEFGIYTQAQKKLMEDRLKLAASIRYDKSKNFDGNFSPRLSAVYAVGEKKNHTFRGSFQTGFRNPTTQDQYIGFNIGTSVLLGSAPDNLERYTQVVGENIKNSGYISSYGQNILNSSTKKITGFDAYNNSFTKSSFQDFLDTYKSNGNNIDEAAKLLRKSNAGFVKPETVKAFDLGYRGDFKGFSFDINGYYNIYNNFIGNLSVLTPYYGVAQDAPSGSNIIAAQALRREDSREFQLYTNTDVVIKSMGFGAGVSKKVIGNFEIGANYNYAQFDFDQSKDSSFEACFNTPKHRAKVSLGNDKLFKNFGFNINGRWSSAYLWQSTFADGMIDPAAVVDAQINYSFPRLKSVLKIGAANIGGHEYRQVLGAGLIGQQYFASLTINP